MRRHLRVRTEAEEEKENEERIEGASIPNKYCLFDIPKNPSSYTKPKRGGNVKAALKKLLK